MATSKTLAIVLGAGPGTGAALAQAFAKTHGAVALLARNQSSLESVVSDAAPFRCDVSSADSVADAFAQIKEKWPQHQVTAALFNANCPLQLKPFLEASVDDLKPGIDVNLSAFSFVSPSVIVLRLLATSHGAFHFSQKVIPLLLEAGGGFLGFSGATASIKGSAKFGTFASTKAALRSLSQSLAREFGPQSVHVSHVIIDGVIDTDRRIDPSAIADTFVYLSQQPKGCWTHELDIRPAAEKW
ncbi:hypothetical protein Rhopal_001556-T1 [Rhodotorula paludigena]|uniref:NAD(P)-binding protein n=1 Tax=Rhodotorula paludigena TaxID=86838 RepID=A0AAV5GG98_9BASI|nr:hypothetical protein Rhopal_001556-T1 [Rhodotorula paludigena]